MKWAWVFLMAAPLAAQTPGSRPAATSLAVLVREAEAANPAIRAARREWLAARQRPSQEAALPDPEFEFSTMNVGGPLPLTGQPDQMMGYAGVGVSETFPFFGKLRLRGEMARRQADIAKARLDLVRRKVRAEVAAAYYRLAGLEERRRVLAQDRKILAAVAKITTTRYGFGQGEEADVLNAQMQMTRVLAEQTQLDRQQEVARARLEELLNRPLGSPAIVPEPLREAPAPAAPEGAAGVGGNPALRARALETARRQLGVRLARRNFYPDVRASYMYEATGPGFPYRTSLAVGISLPIFWGRKQGAALAEAAQREAEARDAFGEEQNRLRYEAKEWFEQAMADRRLLHIDRGGLLPQAASSWRAALAGYQAGREDFESVMAAFLAMQNLDESYWRTLADYQIALARLREVTGTGTGEGRAETATGQGLGGRGLGPEAAAGVAP